MENDYNPQSPHTQQVPPVSVGQWLVTMLICLIPLVNIIMLFVWGFGGGTNPSKSNWAKASLIFAAIMILLYTVLAAALFSSIASFM